MQFVLFSCQKDKAMEGQGIQLPLECNASEEFSIHYLHLFAIDRDNRIARHETFTSSHIHDNTLHAILPLGRYRLALVANAPEESIVIPETGEVLESLFLCLPHEENTNQEANDISTALQSVSITESKNTLPYPALPKNRSITILSPCNSQGNIQSKTGIVFRPVLCQFFRIDHQHVRHDHETRGSSRKGNDSNLPDQKRRSYAFYYL